MQLRYVTGLSVDEYAQQQAWKDAKLDCCPLHPNGGCRLAKHGTYHRKFPIDLEVARWYCPDGHQTFGLLPDCLSSRLPGTLIEVETVIEIVENSTSQIAAADKIRLDIDLPGALRWIQRRLFLVKVTLIMLVDSCPFLFEECIPAMSCFRSVLGFEQVLSELRRLPDLNLYELPPPVGFGPRFKKMHFQQHMGPDPPAKII